MQIKIPKFQLAHLGSRKRLDCIRVTLLESSAAVNLRLFFLQSAQLLFPSNFRRLLMVWPFLAARSAAGSGARRDIIVFL